jgi:hypothetical protein
MATPTPHTRSLLPITYRKCNSTYKRSFFQPFFFFPTFFGAHEWPVLERPVFALGGVERLNLEAYDYDGHGGQRTPKITVNCPLDLDRAGVEL